MCACRAFQGEVRSPPNSLYAGLVCVPVWDARPWALAHASCKPGPWV